MITLEIITKIGTFTFNTSDQNLIRSYKGLDSLRFTDIKGKAITLFSDILQSATVRQIEQAI